MTNDIRILSGSKEVEIKNRNKLHTLMKKCPIPEDEFLSNLTLFLKRQDLTQILFINELYQKIIGVNGCIMEFGVRWGHNMALFESLRGLYEPYNYNRKIIGFDTFEGFRSIDKRDGENEIISEGAYSVTKHYEHYLKEVLQCLENESPISHKKKCELVKGDATKTIGEYLKDHPETIISLAYFDFDIYKPTKECLEQILPHLTKGSVLAFDELNFEAFPGETIALKEVLDLKKYRIQRNQYSTLQSYLVIE